MSESNEPVANVDAMENNQDDDGVEPGGNETGAVDKAHENQTGGNDGGDDGEDGDGGACPLDRSRSSSTGPLVLKSGMVLPKCVHKCNDDQYADSRETVRMMMFLISARDRAVVSDWLDRLDRMVVDKDAKLERLLYVKYLASVLSGSSSTLLEPFNEPPPDVVKPLHRILPPVVYADLLDERPHDDPCARRRIDHALRASMSATKRTPSEDYRFFEQQLFPPEGLMCYAAAFSTI